MIADFHDIYERYARDVHRFALYLSGDPALADDITAESFVRLWTAPGEIQMPTVKSCLLAIARNLYLTGQRRRRRETELDVSLPGAEPSPENLVDREGRGASRPPRAGPVTGDRPRRAALTRPRATAIPGDRVDPRTIGASRQSQSSPGPRAIAHVVPQHGVATMNITRDVITDLLPVYVSGEASHDTQALVEEFLRENPEFAAIVQAARRGHDESLLADHRAIAPDLEREAVRRTRAVIRRQRRALAFAVLLTYCRCRSPSGPTGFDSSCWRRATVGVVVDSRCLGSHTFDCRAAHVARL